MYLLAFLDRVNIGNARVFGLERDLDLGHDNRFNVALVIFFIPYILCEIPSNLLLKKFKPHVWLSINTVGFGLISLIQGFVQNYSGLLAVRFFLGVFESGMYPGCFYLIGCWYRRPEAQKRYSFFFGSTILAGGFGGLLAAAIGKLDGVQGYAGWRWIFIVEGAFTALVGIVLFYLLPDFPEDSKWLTTEEKQYVTARLQVEQGKSQLDHKITIKDTGRLLRDVKMVLGGLMYFGLIVPAYPYAYFAPSIIREWGYSSIQTQLYTVPPWAAAFVFCMVTATLSDYFRHRLLFVLLTISVAVAGLGILVSVRDNTSLQYGALFLLAMGTYSAMPLVICWFNMNLGGHRQRAIGSAWQIASANTAGIISIFAFLERDAPHYTTGYVLCFAFICLSAVTSLAYAFSCWMSNKKRDRMLPNNLTEQEKEDMGSQSPDYRYML
ncbi:High-affinity nicotinic acid transporter [Lithohypha guttulata]|nr:High-affinity nicotinic acid transporter [Lithohypha guttulata]